MFPPFLLSDRVPEFALRLAAPPGGEKVSCSREKNPTNEALEMMTHSHRYPIFYFSGAGQVVGAICVLQPVVEQMRKPFLYLREQGSFFPLFPFYLVGLRKILGKGLLHFNSELTAQDNRIHLVIA